MEEWTELHLRHRSVRLLRELVYQLHIELHKKCLGYKPA